MHWSVDRKTGEVKLAVSPRVRTALERFLLRKRREGMDSSSAWL